MILQKCKSVAVLCTCKDHAVSIGPRPTHWQICLARHQQVTTMSTNNLHSLSTNIRLPSPPVKTPVLQVNLGYLVPSQSCLFTCFGKETLETNNTGILLVRCPTGLIHSSSTTGIHRKVALWCQYPHINIQDYFTDLYPNSKNIFFALLSIKMFLFVCNLMSFYPQLGI